jgi:hypothetical protein
VVSGYTDATGISTNSGLGSARDSMMARRFGVARIMCHVSMSASFMILNAMYDLTTGINRKSALRIATSPNPDPVHEPSWFMRERIWSRT